MRSIQPPRLSGFTLAACALLLLHAVAIPLALHVILGTPRVETLVGHVDRFLSRSQADDSWGPMIAARSYAAAHPTDSLYEEIFFRQGIKFQYPPTSLLFIGDAGRGALNVASWLAVWVTMGATVILLHQARRRAGLTQGKPIGWIDVAVADVCVLGLSVTFYPLIKGYTLGQIQVWVDALFALMVLAWCNGWRASAGACLGIAALIKPPLAPLMIWALTRRDGRVVGGFVAVAAIGLSVSAWRYGLASHVDYLRVLFFIAPRGEAFYPNQSINGLLNRWFDNGSNLAWQSNAFSPLHPTVALGTSATTVLLVASALLLPLTFESRRSPLDLAAMSVAATLASPIAWEHHFGLLLPVFAMVTPTLLAVAPFGRWTAAALALTFLATGQYLFIAQWLAGSWLNPLQSYVFFGALLLLVMMFVAMRQTQRRRSVRGAGEYVPHVGADTPP